MTTGIWKHFLNPSKWGKEWLLGYGSTFYKWELTNQKTFTVYSESLRIQSKCGKIRSRKNSVFGHFSRSVNSFLIKFEELFFFKKDIHVSSRILNKSPVTQPVEFNHPEMWAGIPTTVLSILCTNRVFLLERVLRGKSIYP